MGLRFGKKPDTGERRFKYKELTPEFLKERKNQSGSNRDRYLATGVKQFSAEKDDNSIRILPATWDGGSYGLEVYVHRGIGANDDSYLCPAMVKKGPCFICEERKRAETAGEDEDYVKGLRATKRVAMWLINRAKEGEGPMLWLMPYQTEQEMAAQAVDKKTQRVIQFIDPDEGFDLNFTRKGEKRSTKYIGLNFDRDPSPLSSDPDTQKEWMDYIEEHPIPDILIYRSYEYVKNVFEGKVAGDEQDDDQPTGKLRIGGDSGDKPFKLKLRNR